MNPTPDELATIYNHEKSPASVASDTAKQQAQAVKDAREVELATFYNNSTQPLSVRVAHWEKAIENDPELGGPNLAETAAVARSLISEFGTDALRDALNSTGAGSHPEVARFVSRVAREVARLKKAK